MRPSRLLRLAQIGVFVACLTVPLALYGLGGRSEPVDNRRPIERPQLDIAALFDTETTAEFDAYFDDAFPLRDEAIELTARVDRAFGDSTNPDVVVGRDGWLFLRASVDQPCRTDAELDELARALERADRLVASTGRELINVVAPDKASVRPDRLPSTPTCVLHNARRIDALATSATVVSVWPETAELAAGDERAYRRFDTHWTTRGAAPTARAVVDLLGRWDETALVDASSIESTGDLSVLAGLPQSEPEPRAVSRPGPNPPDATEVPFTDRDGDVVERIPVKRSETDWPGAIDGRTVLLHDSFGDRFADLTSAYFADITTIGDPSPRRSAAAVVAAERIIRLEVQRLFLTSVVGNDLAAEFAIALQDELRPVPIDGDCAAGCTVDGGGSETYLIATLDADATAASVEVSGRRFELDALTPAAAWFVPDTTPQTMLGDLDRVSLSAVAVP